MIIPDEVDKKILFNMDFHARMPLSVLARKLHTSVQVVKYHLDKMTQQGLIQGFYTDINAAKLGCSIFLVYFKFANMTENALVQFISHSSGEEGVGVNASINGTWDHCLGVWAQNVPNFEGRYRDLMKDYEKYVRKKTVMIETKFHYFKPRYLLDNKSNEEIFMSSDNTIPSVDDIDRKILSLLSKNARMSLLDMSSSVGLSANAVRNRIQQMEKKGLILGYRVMINHKLLNLLHYRVFLEIENITLEKENMLIGFLKQLLPVCSVTKTIGFCELEFRCLVKSIDEFYDLMLQIRRSFPEIKSYDSILYHEFYKSLNYFPFTNPKS